MTNVVSAVWEHAAREPDRVALRCGAVTLSYGELASRAGRLAGRLAESGVRPGDRVLLVLPTGVEFVVAYLGTLAAGASAVTVNTRCTAPEFEYFLTDAGCVLAIAHDGDTEQVRRAAASAGVELWTVSATSCADASPSSPSDVRPRDDGDLAVLLYTSGTTGRPKGAMLTHRNIRTTVGSYEELLGIGPGDRLGTALPLFHVFGQVAVMLTALVPGASLSLLHPFSATALLQTIADHGLTIVSGVPTMWIEMLHTASDVRVEDLACLRIAASGGAALPREVARAFSERFGADVLDGYGLSETASAASFSRPGLPVKEGSVGQALPGLELAILDEEGAGLPPGEVGEVAIRGPMVFEGYWGRPEDTLAVLRDGWFRTGDLGRMDADGCLWIVDRVKDMIIRGGYNVYPREVEEALYQYPGVQEAAVVGVPDERLGEEVAAVVVPTAGTELDAAEIRAWLSERLAPYKLPRLYQMVDALPRGATGKLLKRDIDRGDVLAGAQRVHRAS